MPLHLCPLSHRPSLDHHWPPPYSTKWLGPTLGLVSLICMSHTSKHTSKTQSHAPSSTTSYLSKLPLNPPPLPFEPPAYSWSPLATFPTLQNGDANPWDCASDFVQQDCPTPRGAPAKPSHIHQVPPHPAYQLYFFSPLRRLGHHWPPSLLYKMGWPNPWACVSDFVQQACPTQANTPARPSHIHQVPPHPAYQRYLSTLHLCPLSHLPSLGHHWPPSLLYKMGGARWAYRA